MLICGRCGGPLPRPDAKNAMVTCRFCDTTTDVELSRDRSPANVSAHLEKQYMDPLREAYEQHIAQGLGSVPAFRAAAESTLSSLCDPDAITNVVFGLAAHFDREHDTNVAKDPYVLPRLAKAYLQSLNRPTNETEWELNLPFLTATPSGPLHFMQKMSISHLEELAQTPPPPPAPPPEPAPAKEPQRLPPRPVPVESSKPWWKKILG